MTLGDLVIDWNASLHNYEKDSGLVAVRIKEAYEYDGSRRTDRIIGYSVEVADTYNRFEKTTVKVLGITKKPFEISDDDMYLNVFFVGLKGKVYMDYSTGSVKFSFTADGVQVLKTE